MTDGCYHLAVVSDNGDDGGGGGGDDDNDDRDGLQRVFRLL